VLENDRELVRPGPDRVTWRTRAYRLACSIRRDDHLDVLAALRPSATWPADRLREAQEERLSGLLLHAYASVPFYRDRLLTAGVVTDPTRPRVDLSRFAHVPLLTREEVRQRGGELRDRVGRGRRGAYATTTGGTTGDPVQIVRNRETYASVIAVQVWFDEWSGCALGEPRVALSGRRPPLLERARGWIGWSLRNELRLYGPQLPAHRLSAWIDHINRRRPTQVIGPAGLLYEVARYAEATGRPIVPPRAVMTSYEALMPETAQFLRRAFGAPVFNRYGTSELGGIACSCGHEPRMHVSALTHLVEILRADGRPCEPGETGEVVITHLTNHAMPLIRYRIGDLAVPGPVDPCRCGRTLPSIAEVSGRVMDAFVRADGVLLSGSYVRRFYRSTSGLRQFQVVQLAPTHVHVRLVERPGGVSVRHANVEVIERHFQHALGRGCQVTFEFLDEIPRERSGKFRQTVCLIPESDRPGPRRALPETLGPVTLSAGDRREMGDR